MPDDYQEIFDLLLQADEEGLSGGESPKQRAFHNVHRVMTKLGYQSYAMFNPDAPAEIDVVHALQKKLFRTEDMGEGAIFIGAFMFRDLFARISIPIIFGKVAINVIDFVDFSVDQKNWLQSDHSASFKLLDQFWDCFDFGYGLNEPREKMPELATSLLENARTQLEAAAGALCRPYGYAGGNQAALLAVELALKGALASKGVKEVELRSVYGHNRNKLVKQVGSVFDGFDAALVEKVSDQLPNYVADRYEVVGSSRIRSGEIVMKSQYICSEVVRQLGQRNFRLDCGVEQPRVYPA